MRDTSEQAQWAARPTGADGLGSAIGRALRPLTALLAAALLVAVVSACGGEDAGGSSDAGGKVSLVGFSTPQVVYDEVVPAFRRTDAGRGVDVATSFGPSGEQSRAVAGGLAADIVNFSLEPDVTRLVDAGLVARDWKQRAHGGFVAHSVVALIVRPGNPKRIRGWDDLLRPGVEVVTPNTQTSGAAKWNLIAAYAARGRDYLERLLREHVKVQPKSGREALQTFTSGVGDVLISYESEAITARRKGQKLDLVVPDETLRIDLPIALTRSGERSRAAQALLDYLFTPATQRVWAQWGYRPQDADVARQFADRFPQPRRLHTIAELGGWKRLDEQLFDPDRGLVARIEAGR